MFADIYIYVNKLISTKILNIVMKVNFELSLCTNDTIGEVKVILYIICT